MAKLKSVMERFNQVKQAIADEKTKKPQSQSYDNELLFKPVAVQGEERTKFKIRFLPVEESPTGKPWVQINFHMFMRPGDNKYIKVIDPRTFDPKAQNPIADLAKKLFDSNNAVDQENARNFYRKPRYFTLVYVKEAPENQKQFEGKVLVYEAGKQVFDKLNAAINDFDMCFWDPYKGRDFVLILKQKGKEKWADYTDSNFIGSDCAITNDEKVLERIAVDLEKIKIKTAVIDREGVKSGAELKELLDGGMKAVAANASPARDMTDGGSAVVSTDDVDFGNTEVETKPTPKAPKAATSAPKQSAAPKEVEKPKEVETAEISADVNEDEFNIDFNEEDFKS